MGERALHVQHIERFELESGEILRGVKQAYRLDGELNDRRDNLILVFHSLSQTPDAVGGWWADVAGPGLALDTNHWAVLCPNLLGSCFGTTGPTDVDPFPSITIRDQVRLIRLLVDELEVSRIALATGGSLGGMLALEWAASYPDLTERIVSFAAPAALSAFAIGWNHIQRLAINMNGPNGLRIARMIGMMLYRTPDEFERRFDREINPSNGLFQMASYLEHHGSKIVERFDYRCYLTLLQAIATHDVGRDRGGVGPALRSYRGRLVGVGIPGDLLYPDPEVRGWVAAAGAEYHAIHSEHGHDGFLINQDQVGAILTDVLAG